jgi:hypothetical protein
VCFKHPIPRPAAKIPLATGSTGTVNPQAGIKKAGSAHRAYLKRVIHAQVEAKNWRGTYDALKLGQSQFGGLSPDDYAVTPIFLALVTGPNLEAAGEYAVVVQSYLKALKSASSLVPANEIIARLNKIKAEHPKEYADGKLLAENMPDNYPNIPGRPRTNQPPQR